MSYVSFKKLISAALAAAVTISGSIITPATQLIGAKAEDEMKYEFEDAKSQGAIIYAGGDSEVDMSKQPEGTDLSGFSGKGFAYLEQKGTALQVCMK